MASSKSPAHVAAAVKPADLETASMRQATIGDERRELQRDGARYREKAVAFDQRLAQPGVVKRHGDVVAGVRVKLRDQIENAGDDFAALLTNAREQRRDSSKAFQLSDSIRKRSPGRGSISASAARGGWPTSEAAYSCAL